MLRVRKKPLFRIFIFVITSFSCAAQSAPAKITPTSQDSPVTPVDQIIDEGRKQLDQVKIALTTVSGIINDSTTTTVTNKKEALKHIKSLMRLMNTLQKEKFAQVDLETAYSLLQFTKAVSDHFLVVLQNNFFEIEKFDIN